eukprot:m.238196 g.238196  ORF g.238196 m.238196 type:complete len:404 (+) comp17114_c0_seq1:1017-2228(+)
MPNAPEVPSSSSSSERQEEVYGSVAIARVASLPYVSKAVEVASPLFPAQDSAIALRLQSLCEQHAKPVLDRHTETLKWLDTYACQKLDTFESVAANCAKTWEDINKRMNGVRDSVTQRVNNTATQVEHTLLMPTHMILRRADSFLETVLPDESQHEQGGAEKHEGEQQSSQEPKANNTFGAESKQVIDQTKDFSYKVQLRAYALALRQLEGAKLKSSSFLETLRPYSQNVTEMSKKQWEYWMGEQHQQGQDTEGGSEKSALRTLRLPIDRTFQLASNVSQTSMQRIRDTINDLEGLTLKTRKSLGEYPRAISSKAGDLICSVQQTRMYADALERLHALQHDERVIKMNKALLGYLSNLGIRVPETAKKLLLPEGVGESSEKQGQQEHAHSQQEGEHHHQQHQG